MMIGWRSPLRRFDARCDIGKMREGYSKIRNRALAHAFSYMNLIEAWGSGIPKLLEAMKEYGLREPEFQDLEIGFRINLYRNTEDTVIRCAEENIQSGTQATQGNTQAPKVPPKLCRTPPKLCMTPPKLRGIPPKPPKIPPKLPPKRN